MKLLTKQQIIRLHSQLIGVSGGSNGIRDDGMLESAVQAPFQSFDGFDVYPSIKAKAARLGYGIIQNHPFVDGNKRTGTHAMLVFLSLNGIELNYSQEELIEIILSVAGGNVDTVGLLEWIVNHQEQETL